MMRQVLQSVLLLKFSLLHGLKITLPSSSFIIIDTAKKHHQVNHIGSRTLTTKRMFNGDKETDSSSSTITSKVIDKENDTAPMKQEEGIETETTTTKMKIQTKNPFRLAVLRLGMTEPMWTSSLNYQNALGIYTCAYCGNELFHSTFKYNSNSGWPSFWRTTEDASITYKRELDGRLECKCYKCNSHLGHVFPDGPKPNELLIQNSKRLVEQAPSTDPRTSKALNNNTRLPRFCINGAALFFKETKKGGTE